MPLRIERDDLTDPAVVALTLVEPGHGELKSMRPAAGVHTLVETQTERVSGGAARACAGRAGWTSRRVRSAF